MIGRVRRGGASFFSNPQWRICLLLFRETGRGEKKREKHGYEKH